MRPFRFGYQTNEASFDDIRSRARAVQDAGFDVIHTWDHVGPGPAPLAPLVAMAEATTHLRVGPLVLNNDFHHPVHLARELATIDHLSGGRLEVGLGAGHSGPEYAAIGWPFDPPAVRKSRLAESVEILRRLLDGEVVTYAGEHFQFRGVQTIRARQARLPLLVGVNGRRALAHAAQHADIIGLTLLGRTLPDGQHHEARWQEHRLDATVAHIRSAAGGRGAALELNVLVQAVVVTDQREEALHDIVERVPGLTMADATTTPFLAVGTHDEIARHLARCRARWGISYFSVRDDVAFAPVIARLRQEDARAD